MRFVAAHRIREDDRYNVFTAELFHDDDAIIELRFKHAHTVTRHYYEVEGLWEWMMRRRFQNQPITTPDTQHALSASQQQRIIDAHRLIPRSRRRYKSSHELETLLRHQREEAVIAETARLLQQQHQQHDQRLTALYTAYIFSILNNNDSDE